MSYQFKIAAIASVAAAALSCTSASAVTIDFENLIDGVQPAGSIVYPEATFTSSTGVFYVDGALVGQDICTFNAGNCDGDLTVDFASAVSGLSFTTVGDDTTSTISYTVFFGSGGSFAGTFSNDGVFSSLDSHSFGALSDIIKIIFSDDDGAGIAYDNFTFVAGAAAVPEPATWAMMIGGFALAGAAMRRRKTIVAFA